MTAGSPPRANQPGGVEEKSDALAEGRLRLIPILLETEIHPGDSLADKLLESLGRLQPGDILIVKHKIVSKSEGRAGRSRHYPSFR